MKKKIAAKMKTIVILTLILTVFTGIVQAQINGISTKVYFVINGKMYIVETKAKTVAGFLKEQGCELTDDDVVSPDLKEEIKENMTIKLKSFVKIILVINGGEPKEIYAPAGIVGGFAEYYSDLKKKEYKADEKLLKRELKKNMTVALTEIEEEREEEKETVKDEFETVIIIEAIPFDTDILFDDGLPEGEERVVKEGADGEKKIVANIFYKNGEVSGREIISEEITAKPVTEIVNVGTKKTAAPAGAKTLPDKDFEYKDVKKMNASAYTNSYRSTGKRPGDRGYGITASGMKAQVGVVAVDPKVIPLHTELYIEGYGFAVAGDTGSAIKGNKIDLFFDTEKECFDFGRRDVTVYVLN